jgi:hypothetical protein
LLGGLFGHWRETATRQTAFLHIPKCAGTSVNHHLKRHLGSVRSGRAVTINSIDVLGGRSAPMTAARTARYVAGHCGWNHIADLGDTHLRFTFLRRPAERVLSLYGFCRLLPESRNTAHFPLRAARELTFEAFCRSDDEAIRMFIDNAQARSLACDYTSLDDALPSDWRSRARANLSKFDFVGLSERLDEQLPIVCGLIGIPPPKPTPRKNVGAGDVLALPSAPEATEILGDRIAADEELYRRVEQDWDARDLSRAAGLQAPPPRGDRSRTNEGSRYGR